MSTFRIEHQGPLAVLRLDKGRGNAIDDALLADLTAWATEAARDDALRGVLLASAHPKLFSPGLDLVSLVDRDRAAMRDFMGRFVRALWSLYALSKPVVAAVNGAAVAGGCILALTADRRVLARGAVIGLNEVRIGLPVPWSVVLLLKGVVAPAFLADVALLGKNFEGDEALRAGLADAVVEREALEQTALQRLQELAEKEPLAFGATKGWMRAEGLAAMKAHEEERSEVFLDAWFSPRTRELLTQLVASLKKS